LVVRSSAAEGLGDPPQETHRLACFEYLGEVTAAVGVISLYMLHNNSTNHNESSTAYAVEMVSENCLALTAVALKSLVQTRCHFRERPSI
jgi:hypothetical protein